MKKKSKTILGLMIITVLLSSCSLNKVFYSSKKVDKLDKVAIITTVIEFAPATGGIYSGMMNDKISSVSEELNILLKDYATFYRDSLGIFLSKNFNCEVLYGKSLQSNPGFEKLKTEFNFPNALATDKEIFPFMFLSSGDIIPFKSFEAFLRLKPDTSLLKNEKRTIQELCKVLDVNYIAVSYTAIVAVSGSALMRGTLSMVTCIRVFDKDGDYIVWGNKYAQGRAISAGKIEKYPAFMDIFFKITKPMVSEILKKYSLN